MADKEDLAGAHLSLFWLSSKPVSPILLATGFTANESFDSLRRRFRNWCGTTIIKVSRWSYRSVGGIILKEFKLFHALYPPVIAWLVLAALTDVLISGVLVVFLRKNRTGFATTDDILSRITRCMS